MIRSREDPQAAQLPVWTEVTCRAVEQPCAVLLGATRERLAEAYRDRPGIVHFAGHGNDRSLSIIEDDGLHAIDTPLDADRLCEMLQTIQERVRLCVLNACVSEELAQQLVEASAVDCAIGWPGTISDSAAITFSRALYGALGDGRSISDAVDVATVACGPAYKPVLVAGDQGDIHLSVVSDREQR